MELTDEREGLNRNIELTKKGFNRKIESIEFPNNSFLADWFKDTHS